MLHDEPAHLGRTHNIPHTVRSYNYELVLLRQLNVLHFRLRNQPNLLGLQIAQPTLRSLITCESWRCLALHRQPIFYTARLARCHESIALSGPRFG